MRSLNIAPSYGEIQSDVINGLIGRLLMQDIHPDGLDEITLSNFSKIVGELN